MSATDAKPVPRKNTALRIYMEFRDNTGALIAGGVTGQDSERSLDGAAFADCTNEFTEIGTSGMGFLDLTAAEMNTDCTVIKATCTNTNAKPFTCVIYPEEVGDIRVNVTAWRDVDLAADGENFFVDDQGTVQSFSGTGNIVLTIRAAAAFGTNVINGSFIRYRGTTAANYWQYRTVVSSSGDDLTLNAGPTILPTGTITYQILGGPASNVDTLLATMAKYDSMVQLNGAGPSYQFTPGALAQGTAGTDFDLCESGTATAGSANTVGSANLGVTLTQYVGKFVEIVSGTTDTVHHRGFITAQNLAASPPNITFFPPLAAGTVANGNSYKIKKYNPVQLAGITHTSAVISGVAALQTTVGTPAGASLAADILAAKVQIAAIESDTQDLQTRTPLGLVGGRIDANMGSIETAVKDAIAAAVGTRQLPDSYAAVGVQPTTDQALLSVLQCLTEAIVSGTTNILVKKPGGVTTALTLSCSPSVESATSRTRTA